MTGRGACPAGMNWIESAQRCCRPCSAGERCPARVARHSTPWHSRCTAPGGRAPCHPTVPAGTFLSKPCTSLGNDSECRPCPAGTFRTQPNTLRECQACYECDRQGELAPHHTTLCCAVLGRAVPGCSPPAFCSFSECATELLARPLPLLWDLCWTQPCSPQGTERASGTAKQSLKHQANTQTLLCEPPSDEGEHSAAPEPRSALLQGSQLYAVIDVVPVRRWKEFMRMLELREAEIELVELEVTHIRDQQYEMLKRWCQQTSATLDHVFAALERMELAGCAEALRQSLPVGP
uniref:Death domain-containing protein n=1 Tax=Zosterops lateralis melanops TaxID=1220523 RepID=A0A8D2NS03_ZOSLA